MGAGLRFGQRFGEKPHRDTPDRQGHGDGEGHGYGYGQPVELTLHFPDHEKYDLARQVRRSSRSVCANTAEAWRRRRYPSALVAKIIDAEAEASETRVHIEFAHACGYLPSEVAADLDARYDRLLARFTAMRTHPEKCVPRQPPTPHPQAPEKEVDSHRQPSAAANPAQAGPTKPAGRSARSRHREPPSSVEDAETRPPP